MPFESCQPVRGFPSYKGQRNLIGRWWTATTGTLIGYESWLERDRLVLLDFDSTTVGIASQPFWLFWTTSHGKRRSHAPDYFARLADGTALVLDCRPLNRIKPRDQAAFDATRIACAQVEVSQHTNIKLHDVAAIVVTTASSERLPLPADEVVQAVLTELRRTVLQRPFRPQPGRVSSAVAAHRPAGTSVLRRTRPGTVVVYVGGQRLAVDLPGADIDHLKVELLMVERALGLDPATVLRPLYVGQEPRADADAVVMIAPVPMDRVLTGRPMPRKATYFTPKPRSGLVLANLR